MTQTVDQETGEITDTNVTRQTAIASAETYFEAREQKQAGETAMQYAAKLLKPYLEQNGELYDGETGLSARLQPRSTAAWADLESMAADLPPLLIQAALRGLLRLDASAWAAVQKQPSEFVDRFKGFVHKGEGAPSLVVRKD